MVKKTRKQKAIRKLCKGKKKREKGEAKERMEKKNQK